MTQDFAKIRPEPLLERKPAEAPPAWSLMITGMLVGAVIGVFACFLFYLSGNVPPLGNQPAPATQIAGVSSQPVPTLEEPEDDTLELEVYTALPNYEVDVDATPVEITEEQALASGEIEDYTLATAYVLQTGAFQQRELADAEMQRQQLLGLEVRVLRQDILGRTLFLVQSGPYETAVRLGEAERLLRTNNIPSIRMSTQ